MKLTEVMNQMDQTDISRTFYPNTKEHFPVFLLVLAYGNAAFLLLVQNPVLALLFPAYDRTAGFHVPCSSIILHISYLTFLFNYLIF